MEQARLDFLLDKCYVGNVFNRMDIIVRYLVIEEICGISFGGLDLYKKMQYKRTGKCDIDGFVSLFNSIKKENKILKPIKLNKNLTLADGSHRLACSLYLGIENIPIKKRNGNLKIEDYSINWFIKNGFTKEEINKIQEKYNKLFKIINFKTKVKNIFSKNKQKFGKGKFYQGLKCLNIEGQRPTEERFSIYGLDNILDKSFKVLDIGCNVGFFSLYVSRYVKEVHGVEINKSLYEIAELAKKELEIDNCYFYKDDFKNFNLLKYDMIFSFAVHYWINMSIDDYAKKLNSLLFKNGYLLLESHDINKKEHNFDKTLNVFSSTGFKVIHVKDIKDDGMIKRKFALLIKEV